jgi:hypothetical protein
MTGYVRINTRPIPPPSKSDEREPDIANANTWNAGRKPAPVASGTNREHEDVEVSRGP